MKRPVLVWTLPTRLFHWLLVGAIGASWIATFEERHLHLHVAFGYTVLALALFRIAWGIYGPQYSRFSHLPIGHRSLIGYFRTYFSPRQAYIGHNPASSLALVAMIVLLCFVALSGIVLYGVQENRGIASHLHALYYPYMEAIRTVHIVLVYALGAVIAVHIGGVVGDRIFHRSDRTLTSIFDGYKNGDAPSERLERRHKLIALFGLGGSIALWASIVLAERSPLLQNRTPKIDYAKVSPTYQNECGSCHTLYPASLLPKRSWEKVMGGLENHFGDDATLDPLDHRLVLNYLITHSAETSTQEMSVKILKETKDSGIIAITHTPFWKRTHAAIAPESFTQPTVKSKANCKACHSDIEQGTVDDSAIRTFDKKARP